MKITIDTKEDSKSEIKKVISLLQNMLDEPVSNVNIFEDKIETKTETKEGVFNMFSNKNESEASETTTTVDSTADDLLKETNMIEEKEEIKKSNTEVETY